MSNDIASQQAQSFAFTLGDQKKRTSFSFYRGENTNFHPNDASLKQADAVAQYLTKGWMAKEPFIDPQDTTIVAFGSCFAGNISKYLNELGYNVSTKRDRVAYVSRMGDGIVNTYAILQQFRWAWENHVPAVDLWHGYEAEEFGYNPEVQARTRELFDSADVFIITLGLSEIWYDEPTGEVFWRAVPKDKFDPSRHKFRIATQQQNLENLAHMHRLIRKHRPGARLVITVSPIPLTATFRPVSCISANAVSKANLRSAVDDFIRGTQPTDPLLYYFPSYEIVTSGFNRPYSGDRRHVHGHILGFIMKCFECHFCKSTITPAQLEQEYQRARIKDRKMELAGDGTEEEKTGEAPKPGKKKTLALAKANAAAEKKAARASAAVEKKAAKAKAAAEKKAAKAKAAAEKKAAKAKAAEAKAAEAKAAKVKATEARAAKAKAVAEKRAAKAKAAVEKRAAKAKAAKVKATEARAAKAKAVAEKRAAKAKAANEKKAAKAEAAEAKAAKAKAVAEKKAAKLKVAEANAAKAKAAAEKKAAKVKAAEAKAAKAKAAAEKKAAKVKAAEAKAAKFTPTQRRRIQARKAAKAAPAPAAEPTPHALRRARRKADVRAARSAGERPTA